MKTKILILELGAEFNDKLLAKSIVTKGLQTITLIYLNKIDSTKVIKLNRGQYIEFNECNLQKIHNRLQALV